MQKVSHRLLRAEAQLMQKVALLVQQEIEDPRVKNITITRINLSPDLRHAKIFFTALVKKEDKQIKRIAFALNHAAGYLRKRLAENLDLRITPELFFVYDESLGKVEKLLDTINKLVPDSHG